MSEVDKVYKNLVREVLTQGSYKENRTGVSTISKFGINYTIDNSTSFPLLTTKKMDGGRWKSLVHELLWYLSGEHHIKNLKNHTSIWDDWADEKDRLETAYGRYWRRFPAIEKPLSGENWTDIDSDWMKHESGTFTFDQIQYVIDNIKENPNSRRHVVSAWHPENASSSKLPPCHLMFIFNVQHGNTLNLHLTQRSGDIALGVPFNIASYSLLQKIIAQETGLKVGKFNHSIIDAHIYCGKGERAKWYKNNMWELSDSYFGNEDVLIEHIEYETEDKNNYDHIPGLLKQIQRDPFDSPSVSIESAGINELSFKDFELEDYQSHDSIKFGVAV